MIRFFFCSNKFKTEIPTLNNTVTVHLFDQSSCCSDLARGQF